MDDPCNFDSLQRETFDPGPKGGDLPFSIPLSVFGGVVDGPCKIPSILEVRSTGAGTAAPRDRRFCSGDPSTRDAAAVRLLWSSALFRWMSFRVRESPHPWAFFFEFDASYVVLSLCFPSCQGVTTDEVFVPSCSCQDATVVFTERVDLKCVASTVL